MFKTKSRINSKHSYADVKNFDKNQPKLWIAGYNYNMYPNQETVSA